MRSLGRHRGLIVPLPLIEPPENEVTLDSYNSSLSWHRACVSSLGVHNLKTSLNRDTEVLQKSVKSLTQLAGKALGLEAVCLQFRVSKLLFRTGLRICFC